MQYLTGWSKKLSPSYEKKTYYTRKTTRPYSKKGTLTDQQKHIKTLLACSRRRAKERGLVWELDEATLVIPEVCPYLGIPLTYIRGKGRIQSNISIDRIDNTKGYTMDNVEVVSDLANRMKQDATKEQLLTFAKNILNLVV